MRIWAIVGYRMNLIVVRLLPGDPVTQCAIFQINNTNIFHFTLLGFYVSVKPLSKLIAMT